MFKQRKRKHNQQRRRTLQAVKKLEKQVFQLACEQEVMKLGAEQMTLTINELEHRVMYSFRELLDMKLALAELEAQAVRKKPGVIRRVVNFFKQPGNP